MSLETWMQELSQALEVSPEVDVDAVLDLARDAAHQVERPAAPLTTFLAGYAAGLQGGSAADIARCISVATRAALSHD